MKINDKFKKFSENIDKIIFLKYGILFSKGHYSIFYNYRASYYEIFKGRSSYRKNYYNIIKHYCDNKKSTTITDQKLAFDFINKFELQNYF
jgi:hypothetical protein